MDLVPLLRRVLPALKKTNYTVLRLATFAGFATVFIFVAVNTISFVVSLFDLSSSEVSKFIKVITALLSRPNLELEFLPAEFEDLTPNDEGVYTYAPGTYTPLLFRRATSEAQKGAWEWSDDGRQWFATDIFRENPNGMPEPPALIFILRLHVEYLIRRHAANPAVSRRRLPAPLDLGACHDSHLDAAPDVLCCPISHGLMRVPVVAPSGTSFDYDAIRRWVQRHNTDPVNGTPMAEGDLYPNLALRDIIERWLSQQQRGGGEAQAPESNVKGKQELEKEEEGEGHRRLAHGTGAAGTPTEEPQSATDTRVWDGHSRNIQSLGPHLVDLS